MLHISKVEARIRCNDWIAPRSWRTRRDPLPSRRGPALRQACWPLWRFCKVQVPSPSWSKPAWRFGCRRA